MSPEPLLDPTDDPALLDEEASDAAVELARSMLADSLADTSRSERRRLERLGALLADPAGRELIFALTDEVVRITAPSSAAHRFADVVRRHPTRAVGPVDRVMLRIGAAVAPRLPRLVMPLVVRRIKHETRGIVLPAGDPAFARHVERRNAQGVRLNVNPLGEAILSHAEADERMRIVCDRIERADVDYVSVKVSALVAELDTFAFDDSVERVCTRLRELYRRAGAATPPTFVNLDMEEYRDLELTVQSFMRVLDEPEFAGIDAGIVMQAYLPDSHDVVERLGDWAVRRHRATGGRIKVRLVKGANLAMEAVEAELHGWDAAPYPTKADVDASYKRMLDRLLRPEWADAVRIGLASHNLFDVAWALVVAEREGALGRIDFEMLEGMAPAQARAVHAAAGRLLMYAPVVADHDFDASIAYLTRRLDENTQPDNFLRALFTLRPDDASFEAEADRFRTAVRDRHRVSTQRRRGPRPHRAGDAFRNAADTDMTDVAARDEILASIARPPSVADPASLRVDDTAAIDAVVDAATRSFTASTADADDGARRRRWLLDVADLMETERHATTGLLAHAVGKTARESDPEISEAIDFCRYYATEGRRHLDEAAGGGASVSGRGVVCVLGPWNFPYAIPTGGVAAAIAAGNSVVLKAAPESVDVGTRIAEQFWRAGVPRDVLQLVVCDDGPVGRHLVTHPGVDTVVLTGAYATASMFLDWKPDLRLFAETSGKDALVITPSADLDLAIADLVRSAFGHAGQKCSAASLGILVGDLADDESFRRRLRDAVLSLRVGPPTDPTSLVGPLIGPPGADLERALTQLEPGETWLVEPTCLDAERHLWSPGVRLGVAEGSWFHRTECFGPVLGLLRAADLDDAIRLQNATAYGLTGGIHSLDDAEVEHWLARVEVGNAYVNRHITGAIVQRQPFGGWKRSAVGGGAKAGGPDYVTQFARIVDHGDVMHATARATPSYREAWAAARDGHDATDLVAESNVLRRLPLDGVAVRHDGDTVALELIRLAASTVGVPIVESARSDEDDARFVERAVAAGVERVRLLTSLDDDARRRLHVENIAVVTDVPLVHGGIELRHWTREQAISRTRHRHGRLVH